MPDIQFPVLQRQGDSLPSLTVAFGYRQSYLCRVVALLDVVERLAAGLVGLDQVFEGKPTVLIKDGQVVEHALAQELLTRAELMTVLHRQGFSELEEVEECVLEPGGMFAIRGKKPPLEEVEHREVMRRLDDLSGKLVLLLQQKGGV